MPFNAETRPSGGGRKSGYMAQRKLCEDIIGKQGTPEYDKFVESTRRQILAGVCPSGLVTLLLHYGYGKPVDRIEVTTPKNELEEVTEDMLRDRARRLAVATFTALPSSTPESGDDSDTMVQ